MTSSSSGLRSLNYSSFLNQEDKSHSVHQPEKWQGSCIDNCKNNPWENVKWIWQLGLTAAHHGWDSSVVAVEYDDDDERGKRTWLWAAEDKLLTFCRTYNKSGHLPLSCSSLAVPKVQPCKTSGVAAAFLFHREDSANSLNKRKIKNTGKIAVLPRKWMNSSSRRLHVNSTGSKQSFWKIIQSFALEKLF